MDGYLLVDKPSGWTSFDVVNKLRGQAAAEAGVPRKRMKVGHTGTLDPMATGLLILTFGSYCKRVDDFMKLDKTYEATMVLGATSTTDDAEGEITATAKAIEPSRETVADALSTFTGQIDQVPPQFSAIKVAGRRAYAAARAGKTVVLKSRSVTVYRFDLVDYAYPELQVVCEVSSGTYIRSLARDVGQKLQTGAYLSQLRRTHISTYDVAEAVSVAFLNKQSIREQLKTLDL